MTQKPNTWPFMASEAVRNGTAGGGTGKPKSAETPAQQDEAKPGKGENQAGFIKPDGVELPPTEPETPEKPD